jgi:hypothetical protein
VTRAEFQAVAELRARDAEILLNAQRWDGAYYVAGYAVECGLKACIAKMFKQDDIPEPDFVRKIYTHDLEMLLERANIRQHIPLNSPLDVNWGIVFEWSESSRYRSDITQTDAVAMCNAVNAHVAGILPWLKNYW